jgi:hypothetical protein
MGRNESGDESPQPKGCRLVQRLLAQDSSLGGMIRIFVTIDAQVTSNRPLLKNDTAFCGGAALMA